MTDARDTDRGGWWRRLLYRGPDLDTLHDDFARRGRIDDSAPIAASHQVTIAASTTQVWQVLADPARWCDVDPAIRDVHVDDGVVEGGRFTWRKGRTRLASRFAIVDRDRELTWTGNAFGVRVVHRHVLEPTDDGGTRLFSEESMAGPFLVLFFNHAKLHRVLEHWLNAVSIAATERAITD